MEPQPQPTPDERSAVLDDLVGELLVCASGLNHLITGMIEWEMTQGSPPDAPPLAQVACSLVSGVAADRLRHSKRDLRVTTAIIQEITAAVREDIYVVNPDAYPDADLN